jgi:hypothetical protein
MSVASNILDRIMAGSARAFNMPMPQATDSDILNLYRGRYNQYATPEALRDVELGIQRYLDNPRTPLRFTLDGLRDQALRARGLGYDQSFDEIPEKSPTGRILREIINLPATGEYSGV